MKPQPWSRVWTRLPRPGLYNPRSIVRNFCASSHPQYQSLYILENATLDTFQQQCFLPEQPAILPRSTFQDLPALKQWFNRSSTESTPGTSNPVASLNVEYLHKHGADAFVPLELTESTSSDAASVSDGETTEMHSFRQFHAPLSLFLDWMRTAETTPQSTRLYLAQCQLLDLPPVLREDFPTPELVARAGKGDVYDTNVWIGHPPTYTPLHRDPNPNLFVQLAGEKVVRLLAPADGQAVFGAVRRQLGKSGSREAAAFRGEEMMQGRERALLDEMVWRTPVSAGSDAGVGFEAYLEAGDSLFIPKGWWHSIKGIGGGVTASFNVYAHINASNLKTGPRPIFAILIFLQAHLTSTKPESCKYRAQSTAPLSSTYPSIPSCAPRSQLALFGHPSTRQPNRQTPASTASSFRSAQPPSNQTARAKPAQCVTHPTPLPLRPQTPPPKTQTLNTKRPKNKNPKKNLYLPASDPSNPISNQQGEGGIKIDMSGGGSEVKLDHLGPMVVNVDGTLSQIGNWQQMTEIEKSNTLRVLGKRNKKRLEALKAKEKAEGGSDEA
ncbi:hypothetical protein N7447_010469 [Penicillium robsamsonii]|uniref:uncharacterized protein n=1 Tax=Penicillium robsamsonii TaxID=1792511 RepID=UPI002546B0C1|nr:uncharacterized protein N7447_010469 [Penicillium robsamsonii]KAJ5810953.1 hypothetical protein N7447_010469 [Penicillium robsamsonii]